MRRGDHVAAKHAIVADKRDTDVQRGCTCARAVSYAVAQPRVGVRVIIISNDTATELLRERVYWLRKSFARYYTRRRRKEKKARRRSRETQNILLRSFSNRCKFEVIAFSLGRQRKTRRCHSSADFEPTFIFTEFTSEFYKTAHQYCSSVAYAILCKWRNARLTYRIGETSHGSAFPCHESSGQSAIVCTYRLTYAIYLSHVGFPYR